MPQIINTNIASLNAQRNLNASQRDQESALQRLSSGLRINSAKDDAAGLAISSRFDAQVRGTAVAVRNSGDAISLAQTAEGALDSINKSLQRIRELSLQSANDTNTAVDRQALQEEVDQLVEEIQNVAEGANFNGKKLLDGSFQNSVFQTGANVGDTVAVSIGKIDANSLGVAATSGISSSVAETGITAEAALVAGDLTINGVSVGASVGTSDNASSAFAASSSIAKAAAINAVSDQSGVTATVNTNTVEGNELTAAATVASQTLTINGVALTVEMAGNDLKTDLDSVATAINEKAGATGVEAEVVATDGGFRIDLSAEDGRNITITAGTTTGQAIGLPTAAAGTATTFVGDYTLVSEDGSDITLSSATGDIETAGFEEGVYSGTAAGVVGLGGESTAGTDPRQALNAGDLIINGVDVGPTSAKDDTSSTTDEDASAISLAAAINRISDQTGVTADVQANTVSASVAASATAIALEINGVAITAGTNNDQALDSQSFIDAVNAVSGQTGVTAEAVGTDLKLVAEDGRNIEISALTTAGGLTLEGAAPVAADVHVGAVSLKSGNPIELTSITGDIDSSGFKIGTFGGSEAGTLLSDLDITTAKGAEAAIKAVDNAISTVASRRAELGAIQNRFESTIANLEISGENLAAANSRIKDADFAQETAALSRSQVLQQAGISVLAQANGRPQQVLSLLQ